MRSTRLVGDRARYRLPYPPGGVGRELVAALVLELLDRAHEADVPLLDQVEEAQAAVRVALGDRDDEAEVRLDERPLTLLGAVLAAAQAVDRGAQRVGRHADLALDLAGVLPPGTQIDHEFEDVVGGQAQRAADRGRGGPVGGLHPAQVAEQVRLLLAAAPHRLTHEVTRTVDERHRLLQLLGDVGDVLVVERHREERFLDLLGERLALLLVLLGLAPGLAPAPGLLEPVALRGESLQPGHVVQEAVDPLLVALIR